MKSNPALNYHRRVFLFNVLGFSLLMPVAGCGGDSLELVQVTGLVTFDGAPLVDAEIVFQPEDGRPSFSRTDENGRYELQYTDSKSGAVTGVHTVRISSYIEKDMDSENPMRQEGREEFLPESYHSKSTLMATLTPGKDAIIDFPLTTNGAPPSAK